MTGCHYTLLLVSIFIFVVVERTKQNQFQLANVFYVKKISWYNVSKQINVNFSRLNSSLLTKTYESL